MIPSFKPGKRLIEVLSQIPGFVDSVIVVDDACPESSGAMVQRLCDDNPRLHVIYNEVNLGVGGATMRGFELAVANGADIVVKIDADGQMDPSNILNLVSPLVTGDADFAKGNRLYRTDSFSEIPVSRLIGNAFLTLLTKVSSGYWHLADPVNGFIGVNTVVLGLIDVQKIDKRFFFETDLLFRLNLAKAVAVDIPMAPIYRDEASNLSPVQEAFPFLYKNLRNLCKRLFYQYYLRDFSVASIELPLGLILLSFGIFYGLSEWVVAAENGIPASPGTVMLAGLTFLVGLQFLLAFVNADVASVPKYPVNKLVSRAIQRE